MTITPDIVARIQAFRAEKGINQTDLGKLIGLDRSTVSKILKGEITTLKPKTVEAFLDHGLELRPLVIEGSEVSQTAIELSEMARNNPDLAATLEFLKRIANPKPQKLVPFMPDIDTKKLPKVGAVITEIVHRWEEGADPHYAKIAGEVLDWVRGYYRDGCP